MLNRAELAAFLRSRRDRLRPHDVGLPDSARRRTPGLRRQEVAQLAGMSVEYYIRLEQARGPHPSKQILSALARALMLTTDEREYLFRIAGENPPLTAGPSRQITVAIQHLLDSMPETPAYVLDAKYEVLAWNRLATYFIGDLSTVPESERNVIRWVFRQAEAGGQWDDPESVNFARASVADLRAAYARYPGDPGIEALVTELLGVSRRFSEMWAAREVEVRRPITKRVEHPRVGLLEFDCQILHIPDTDQRMTVYSAPVGSPTHTAFRRLAEEARHVAPAAVDRARCTGSTPLRSNDDTVHEAMEPLPAARRSP